MISPETFPVAVPNAGSYALSRSGYALRVLPTIFQPMNSTLRILDANFNRAREALRVMEEFARFVLDDALLSSSCKMLRHDLANAAVVLQFNLQTKAIASGDNHATTAPFLVANRDIVYDVGRETKTLAESQRHDSAAVVIASAKRLSEALRAMEEYGKVLDSDFAAATEMLRYRGYELERRFALTISARARFSGVRLYVIVTEALCRADWFATAQAALDGGADCLQLREKNLPDLELLSRARQLSDLCGKREKLFIMNDRADIAAAANAHGLHLGQDDLPLSAARRIMPSGAIIGLSTHTLDQVKNAATQCPDYIAIGPMFTSETKPQSHLATPQLVSQARDLTSLPLVAIGGITAQNAAQVVDAGAECLCVCSAVISSPDPAAAASMLRSLLSDRQPKPAESNR
jgi:thiamine-phosphate pyrophosphorylase